MNTDKRGYLSIIFTIIFSSVVSAQTIKIAEYYQLKDGNSWNYVAPQTWKGDYVSLMETGRSTAKVIQLFRILMQQKLQKFWRL